MSGPRHFAPFLVTLGAVGLLSLMDAVMKQSALAVGTYNTLLVRSLFAIALAAPIYLAIRTGLPSRQAMRLHLLRGTVGTAMAFTFFWSLTKLPLAEAIALSFTSPHLPRHVASIQLAERL